MDHKTAQEIAGKQLDRVLGFFPRVDAKASFLFAMNTGILALLVLNLQLGDLKVWFLAGPAVVAVALLIASYLFVYRCTFPHLKGGAGSLIYFREIAKRTEANFVSEFLQLNDQELARDLSGQIWRNSEILKTKFDSMKIAFVLTAIALIPWVGFLLGAALLHSPAGLILK